MPVSLIGTSGRRYPLKTRRLNKRRRRTRYRKRRNTTTVMMRGLNIVPDKYFCKLVYQTPFTLNDAVGGVDTYFTLRGNSIYDPDYTGVGNQPVGRDELATLYNKYKVLASSVVIDFLPAATNNASTVLTVIPKTIATYTTIRQDIQNPYCHYKYGGNSASTVYTRLKHFMKSSKIHGDSNCNDEDYESSMTVDPPTNVWYWHIGAIGVNSAPFTLYCQVRIVYYCEFSERLNLLQS